MADEISNGKIKKMQSSSFSTVGGNVRFEARVEAASDLLILAGQITPCIQPWLICKIKRSEHLAI